jgi:serine/threonine-protein kinase HipA
MSERLYVHYQQQLVGTLSRTAARTMRFAYDDGWLLSANRFPVSLSLPLDGTFTDSDSQHFFANLLPEGNVREQICKSLKISADNDFELLKAIGGDCAGALTITGTQSCDLQETPPRYETVTDKQLARWSQGAPNVFAAVTGQRDIRLSLAGAQDKLPVYMEGTQIMIPLGNAPSTHLLKFASPHYSHLPENETFITLLAKEVGLPVVNIRIRKTVKLSITIIARYDRRSDAGRWIRIHQEDFCQALGIDASRKYEKEGGPGYKQCADLIRQHVAFPLVDLQKLLRWSLYNLLIGNADAHGKNLSLLYDSSGTPSLAPFYDLVCTRNYNNLSREMAMSVGGAWNPDIINAKHLSVLAEDLGIRPNIVLEQAKELSERIAISLPRVVSGFREQFGDSPVLGRLPGIIRKLVRRVSSQLK